MDGKLTGTIRISNRDVDLDAERVKEGAESRFWELMVAKINGLISDAHMLMENSADDREIAQAQGAARALRKVLQLPETIRRNIPR